MINLRIDHNMCIDQKRDYIKNHLILLQVIELIILSIFSIVSIAFVLGVSSYVAIGKVDFTPLCFYYTNTWLYLGMLNFIGFLILIVFVIKENGLDSTDVFLFSSTLIIIAMLGPILTLIALTAILLNVERVTSFKQ